MPYIEKEIGKRYYTVREVAAMVGEPTSYVRYVSDAHGMNIKRSRNGHRLFNREQAEHIVNLHRLRSITTEGLVELVMKLQAEVKELSDKLGKAQ